MGSTARRRQVFGRARPTGAGLSALLAVVGASLMAAGAAAGQRPDVPPPPPPAENFVRLSEAEILTRLPERERERVEREQGARDKFEALLDVSDERLDDLGDRIDAGAGSLSDGLILYQSILLAADDRLRSPEANVKPRDKRFKKFERELNKQLGLLRAIVADLPYEDAATGVAVLETVERLRAAALNSALDVDILSTP